MIQHVHSTNSVQKLQFPHKALGKTSGSHLPPTDPEDKNSSGIRGKENTGSSDPRTDHTRSLSLLVKKMSGRCIRGLRDLRCFGDSESHGGPVGGQVGVSHERLSPLTFCDCEFHGSAS